MGSSKITLPRRAQDTSDAAETPREIDIIEPFLEQIAILDDYDSYEERFEDDSEAFSDIKTQYQESKDQDSDIDQISGIEHDSDVEPLSENSISCPQFANLTDFAPYEERCFSPEFKAGDLIRESTFSEGSSATYNHFHPFINGRDYKLARFFTESKVPKVRIDQFFKEDLIFPPGVNCPTSSISFRSAYQLQKKITEMRADPP